LQLEVCPKKDDVALLVVISLGYSVTLDDDYLDTRRSANAHGQLSRTLTVRYSGSEDEIDRKLFRESIRTSLIFLHPPLLCH
jgi:hypothetical protein